MMTIYIFWFIAGIAFGMLFGAYSVKHRNRSISDHPLLIVGPNGSVIIPDDHTVVKDHPAIKEIVEKARKAGL